MIKTTILISFLILVSLTAFSQKNVNSLVVVSYNVENLFDTVNSPLFDDDAFTPAGSKKWTFDRYKKKLNDLALVFDSIPGRELPAVIGLAEIENREVLEDLINTRRMQTGKFEIVHEDGVDPRGIECALIYRPELFRYISHEYIPIKDSIDPEYLYRSILHVKGTGPDGLTLHLFMNHWKSRSGGMEVTERQRILYAHTIRERLDKIFSGEANSKVIVMGDFNDEPTNRSITHTLSALNKRQNIHAGELYNLFYDSHNLERTGSYNYRGTWNMLDQVLVSFALLNQEQGLTTGYDKGKIFSQEWMLYDNEKYGAKLPSSTYGGPNYYGGPSDHLPVYVTFTW